MPDITYNTIYTADDSRAVAAIDRIIAKHVQLGAIIDANKAKLKDFGRDMPGVVQAIGSLGNLGRAFSAVDGVADKAFIAIRRVGQDTGGMTRSANKALELAQKLREAEIQALSTGAAVSGVGAGGIGGTGGGAAGGGRGVVGTAGRVVVGSIVHKAINATVGAFADSQEKERDFQNDTAARAIAFREKRRELANLMGHTSPNAAVVKSSLDLMRAAGMTDSQEAEFSTEYYNSAAAGRDKGNLGAPGAARDALEARIRTVGAKSGVRTGVDAGTAGDLTGIISTYKKINSEKDVAGEWAGIHYGLDQGRGRMNALMRSELSQAGSKVTAGYSKDMVEQAALIGVLSGASKSGSSAGTSYGQMSRLLNEATGPDAEFLKQIGVSDAKGDVAKLHVLGDYFKKNNVTDINKHLAEKGFGNQQDRNQVTYAVSQIGLIDDRIKESRRRQANPDAFIESNEEFRRSTLGVSRSAKSEEEAAEIERGTQSEALINLRTAGRAHRTGPQHIGPQRGSAGGGFSARVLGMMGAGDGEQELDDIEGLNLLGKRFEAVGRSLKQDHPELVKQVGTGFRNPFSGQGRTPETNELRQREVAKATAEVEQLEKAARDQQQAAGGLNQAAAALNQAAAALNPGGANALQGGGKPAVVNKRP